MRGFSIRYVAEHLNYAPNTIANWEKGKSSPPADVLILMTGLFDVGPEQLFGSKPCPELDEFLNKKKPIMDTQLAQSAGPLGVFSALLRRVQPAMLAGVVAGGAGVAALKSRRGA